MAVAVIVFVFIIFKLFTDNKVITSNNYWHSPELFELPTDSSQVVSLEWAQSTPPAAHTYNELPYVVLSK